MRAVQTLAFALLAMALPLTSPAEDQEPAHEAESQLGPAVSSEELDTLRGADQDIVENVITVTGEVTDNTATNVVTGANNIQGGSFDNASGVLSVVQNTGANVLIQSATIAPIAASGTVAMIMSGCTNDSNCAAMIM